MKIATRRPGDPAEWIASSEKAQAVLGWHPKKSSIRQMVQDAWRWHSSHPDGYKSKKLLMNLL
ncbi:hypothetical protein [Bacillus sp. J33]|uniref:hypothetical protein n=1 Tax=Bacillus sp. J33 TaxID=935836 RepID=UPI00047D0368|nr:hypothetical protein [Bacillus sp. J33]